MAHLSYLAHLIQPTQITQLFHLAQPAKITQLSHLAQLNQMTPLAQNTFVSFDLTGSNHTTVSFGSNHRTVSEMSHFAQSTPLT